MYQNALLFNNADDPIYEWTVNERDNFEKMLEEYKKSDFWEKPEKSLILSKRSNPSKLTPNPNQNKKQKLKLKLSS